MSSTALFYIMPLVLACFLKCGTATLFFCSFANVLPTFEALAAASLPLHLIKSNRVVETFDPCWFGAFHTRRTAAFSLLDASNSSFQATYGWRSFWIPRYNDRQELRRC